MKVIFIGAIIILVVGVVGFLFFYNSNEMAVTNEEIGTPDVAVADDIADEDEQSSGDTSTDESGDTQWSESTSFGTSVDGEEILAYRYGTGEKNILFVGGIHSGYSWNTVLVARELMEYLEANPEKVPDDISVHVIDVLNPDGVSRVPGIEDNFGSQGTAIAPEATIPGRFNANEVDLNRNFDCKWQSAGTWQNRTVSGGSAPFSEPESRAFRDYVNELEPDGVVVWYAAAGGVFASNCENGVLPETLELTKLYADASGYSAHEEFNFYKITGDMVNWLASENIPAISVLLTDHEDVEWSKNKKGIEAILDYYAE